MSNKLNPSTDPFVMLRRDLIKVTDRLMYLERQIGNLTNVTLNLENALYQFLTKHELARDAKHWSRPEDVEDAIEP
jgi:hypothetical protein